MRHGWVIVLLLMWFLHSAKTKLLTPRHWFTLFGVRDMVNFAGLGRATIFFYQLNRKTLVFRQGVHCLLSARLWDSHNLAHCRKDWKTKTYEVMWWVSLPDPKDIKKNSDGGGEAEFIKILRERSTFEVVHTNYWKLPTTKLRVNRNHFILKLKPYLTQYRCH